MTPNQLEDKWNNQEFTAANYDKIDDSYFRRFTTDLRATFDAGTQLLSATSITRYGFRNNAFDTFPATATGLLAAVGKGQVDGSVIRLNLVDLYFGRDVDFVSNSGAVNCLLIGQGTRLEASYAGVTFRSPYQGAIELDSPTLLCGDGGFHFDAVMSAPGQGGAVFKLTRVRWEKIAGMYPTTTLDVLNGATLVVADNVVAPELRFVTDATSKIILRGTTNGTIGNGPSDIWPAGTVDERLGETIWRYVGDPSLQSVSLGQLDLASNVFDPSGLNESNIFYAAQFVSDNTIGPDFSANLVYGELRKCTIGFNCIGNIFRPSVTDCTLGDNVSNCYFDVDTHHVHVGDNCKRVTLYNCAGTPQQPFVVPAGTTDATYRNNQLVGAGNGTGTAYSAGPNIAISAANQIRTQVEVQTSTELKFDRDYEYMPISTGTFAVDLAGVKIGAVVTAYLTKTATDPARNLPAANFQLLAGAYVQGVELMYTFKAGANGMIQYVIKELP